MNRRSFFAAVVGGAVAPKVAVLPHLKWPTAASKAAAMRLYQPSAAFLDFNRKLKALDLAVKASLSERQFRLPLSFKGPKP